MANKTNGKSFLIGTVVGGVVGAAAALLLAPKSGRELRADIAEQAQAIGEKTQEIAGSVSQRTQEVAKSVGTQTSEWVGKAREAAAAIAQKLEAYRESRRQAEEAADLFEEAQLEPAPEEPAAVKRELLEVK
ncbi:YtxH domain-containing protein [Paenibacillus sp. MBLB4367]|uniref:YtxH domain-containing protein n=1 Tax=Paenibacillus sp. MBLB4367 TaxID=3384767 RepID=UPI003907EA4B